MDIRWRARAQKWYEKSVGGDRDWGWGLEIANLSNFKADESFPFLDAFA